MRRYYKYLINLQKFLLFKGDNLREIGNLGENDIKNKLLVAAAAVSDHGTNNNLCTAASMASANGGHMNSLEGQHLGLHGLTHHGKLETVPKK